MILPCEILQLDIPHVGRNHILYFFLVPVHKIISVQEIYLDSLFLYVVSLFEQHLNSSVRLVLLSGDMYPREPISNGINFTFALVMSGMKWEYFSVQLCIWVSNGTVSSKINIKINDLSWKTISGRSGVTQRSVGQIKLRECPFLDTSFSVNVISVIPYPLTK